nr:glycine, alanine and asparagine-rich protein-like [Aegilops tauschii subsp. strangulata]
MTSSTNSGRHVRAHAQRCRGATTATVGAALATRRRATTTEQRQQAQQSAVEGWSPSANAVTRSGSYGAGGRAPFSDPYPSHGGERPADGHGQPGQNRQGGNGGNTGGRDRNAGYAGNGRQGGGGNAGNNNGGGGGRRNRWRPRCQFCKNWGHEADDCRKRYDQDHNSCTANLASTNTVDFPWVLDTGATDHLTNDLEHLQVHERYDGKDRVQVANGAGDIALSPPQVHVAAPTPPDAPDVHVPPPEAGVAPDGARG